MTAGMAPKSAQGIFSGAFHKKLEGELELLIAESKAHGMERDSFLTLCADLFSECPTRHRREIKWELFFLPAALIITLVGYANNRTAAKVHDHLLFGI